MALEDKIPDVVAGSRGIDHEDNRRTLKTIFNGDFGMFSAAQVKIIDVFSEWPAGDHHHPYRELFFVEKGSAHYILRHIDSGIEMDGNLVPGSYVMVPPRVHHVLFPKPGTTFFALEEDPASAGEIAKFFQATGVYIERPSKIPGLACDKNVRAHTNASRSIQFVCVGENPLFRAAQVKIADVKLALPLGGHYHSYFEMFFINNGTGEFTVEDPSTRIREEYIVAKGGRILIPPGIAHKVTLTPGAQLIGLTQEPYISPKHNDVPYAF